jgi:TP901 family phage tail tape measure protein
MSFSIGSLTASLGIDTAGLERAAAKMNEFQRKIDASAKKVNASLRSTGESMKQVGKSATRNITVPMTLAATAAVKLFSDYEASISKVVGLVGVAAETTDKWAKDILKIAPQVAKAPAELADALFFVTSAGIRGAEAMDVLTISAKASAAGLGETKVVADLVTSAMNAYGPALLDAQKATDILVATVKEGKAPAAELAASMGQVLPIASAMSVSFDEVGAAIAAMTRTGTNAATASTQLRQILNSILKPAKASEEAMRAMGTSSTQLRKTIREDGLLKALLDINTLTKKFGEETVAKVFPNIRALSGVLDLMGKNVADNVKIFDSLEDSTGSLDMALAAASETFKFQFNQAVVSGKVALTVLGESIAKALLPLLQKLIGWLTRLAQWFNDLTESQKKWILGIGLVVAAFGPLLVVLGFLVGNVLPGLITVTVAAAKAFTFLKLAIIANPLGAMLTALATLIALYIAFKGKADKATESQKNLNKELKNTEQIANRGKINKFLKEIGVLQNKLITAPTGITFEVESIDTSALNKVTENISKLPLSYLEGIQSLISEEIIEVKRQLENFKPSGETLIDQSELGAITTNISTLQTVLKKVNAELERASKIKPFEDGEKGLIPPAITEALAFFAAGQERIIKLQQAFRDSFDITGAKITLYEESIVSLIDAGVDPLSQSIQILAGRLDLLNFSKDLVPLKSMETNLKRVMGVAEQMRNFSSAKGLGLINSDELFESSKSLELVTNELKAMPHIAIAAGNAMAELTDPTLLQTFGGIATDIFSGMSNVIADSLNSTESIFKAFGKSFINVIKGMIIKLIAATIAALALVTVLSFIPGFGGTGAFTGIKAATTFGKKFTAALGSVGLAEGGIVPPGFPNDSFNARLTSNEAVIPLDRLPQLMGMSNNREKQQVVFRIDGKDLVGIMETQSTLNQAF